ncbi:ATPase [Thalassotalea sp. M1531]|uniref:ATPase n=1 Tax=Thalassotalea algicola TaxID=2716224 RepID=A0A7Y0Q4R9_9GAMM|nr:BadF/BadG/BcrA/BcrD ATPase family protein [Thalassotalea algicola]NMP30274.1 ATPase [Thalassotalea algicola]
MLKGELDSQGLFLGIDGGGSKCKAILVDKHNNVLGTGISGPGNPLHGFEQATNSIEESAKLALTDAGIDVSLLEKISAGVGLAGVNLPVLFEQMNNWQHPFKDMYLATDLLIACLGAHGGEDGAVMITGTGSCGFVYVDGQSHIVGAHGFPHGDKGSGAWIGLQAAKQVLLSLDGLVESTILTQSLLSHLDAKDAIEMVEAIAAKPAAFYAKMAGLVFEAANKHDAIAQAIIEEGADYISRVARKLLAKNPPRISLIGGLTPLLTPWLDQDIQDKLTTPEFPPEMGSVIFGRQQAV